MQEPATQPAVQAVTEPATQPATGAPEEPPPWAGSGDPLARPRYLHSLGERIAEMSAHIDSATWRLLTAIAEYDRYEGWASEFPSCAHWLAYRCQLDMRTAQDRVKVARALERLPRIGQALREGRLSYSKVRAVVRICGPENEGEMLYLALNSTTEQMERIVRGYRRATQGESLAEVAARQEQRYLWIYPDGDGMVVIRARVTAEVGAVVKKALEAAMEVVKGRRREGAEGAAGEVDAGSVSGGACGGEVYAAGSSDGTETQGQGFPGGRAAGAPDLHALRAAHDPRDPVPRIDIGGIQGLPAWGVIDDEDGEEWVLVETPRADDDRDCWYPPGRAPAAAGCLEGGGAGAPATVLTGPAHVIPAKAANAAASRDPVLAPGTSADPARGRSDERRAADNAAIDSPERSAERPADVIPAKAANAAASRDPVLAPGTSADAARGRSDERRGEDSAEMDSPERSAERSDAQGPAAGSAEFEPPSPRAERDLLTFLEDNRRESVEKLRADALGVLAEAALGGGLAGRLRGEPYQVVLHVDAGLLAGKAEEGRCELEEGAGVSAETCRRLACDGALRVVTHGKGGAVEDVGRRSRKIPLALWRVLQERDRHCRFPGCHRTEKLHGHHIVHWAHGGATNQNNVLSLCAAHHWKVHEGGYRVVGDASGEVIFLRPDGSVMPRIPASPRVPTDPMGDLVERSRVSGLEITPEKNHVGWGGEPLDLVWIVEGLLQAEAEYKRTQEG